MCYLYTKPFVSCRQYIIYYKTLISQGKGLKFDSEIFKAAREENISGWQNPNLFI